ncbi:hypothetical protein Tco_1440304 [Tanacetum coccineum]
MTTPSPSPPISLSPPSAGERLARYEIGESSTARPARGQGIDYGFVSTVDAEERRQGIRDVGVVELAELQREGYTGLVCPTRGCSGWRQYDGGWRGYASREAWAHSIGLSQATHQELQTHRDHVYAHETYLQAHQTQLQLQSTLIQTQHQVHETRFQMQHAELAALRETDRRRQDQMVETLRVIRDMRREMSDMQAELLALREQYGALRQVLEARISDHQEASGDADNKSWHLQPEEDQTLQSTTTTINNMTTRNPFQAMIDRALLRNSTIGDGSTVRTEIYRKDVAKLRVLLLR